MAVCWCAIVQPLLGNATAEYGRVIGLANYNLGVRALFFEHARHAFECAPRAKAGDPEVEFLARESIKNLRRCSARVRVRIGFIFKLSHEEPVVFLRQLRGLGQHTTAF